MYKNIIVIEIQTLKLENGIFLLENGIFLFFLKKIPYLCTTYYEETLLLKNRYILEEKIHINSFGEEKN